VESPEQCDDGNLLGGDTCTPQCTPGTGLPLTCCPRGSEVAGSTVVANRELKLTKLGGIAGDERFNSPGETILLPGQEIHPCTEAFSYCLEDDNGVIYGPDPATSAGPALPGSAFGPKPPCLDETVPMRRVRATFQDKTLLVSEPDGLKKVLLKNPKSQANKYKHQVQGKDVNLSAAIGATRLRQTLVIGDTCMTSILTCVDKNPTTKVCVPAP
jgi:cysteine-rich repeat protein